MLKQAIAAATVGAAFAVPVVVFAQPAGADTPVQADPNSESGASYRATELLDSNVRNEQGDVLAEVEDFVLDSESNQIQYVILSYGNVAEADAQFYVVPASQFFVHRDADVIYLQTPLTVDVIKRAPAFPRAQWVNIVRRPDFFVGVNRFWTGAGVNVGVNRGFGRRGQINAIDVNVLDNANRPGAPGAPGNLNDPNRPNNPGRPDRPRPDAPGNVNPDRPGADAPGADRPRGPRPNAPNNPPGAGPANPPGAGPANPPGAGPGNPPGRGPGNPPGRGPGNPPGAGAGAGGNAGAGAGANVGGAGAAAGAGAGVNLPNVPALPGR